MNKPSILLVAGEVSGDMHAASVVAELRKLRPDARFFGIGGPCLRSQGMELFYDLRDMAVLGLTEVARKYLFFRRVFKHMLKLAHARRPALALLVDYPGFNLPLANALNGMGVKVIYYICPQVWAWRRGRITKMAACVQRLIAIFPFEPAMFNGTSLKVDFVGHPLVDEAQKALEAPEEMLPWTSGGMRFALLPGSRVQEIRRILPCMWRAASALELRAKDCCFIIAAANEEADSFIRGLLPRLGAGPRHYAVVCGRTRQVLRQARAALVASGTATMESAFMRCPMAIVYKVSWPTYLAGRLLIRVPYLGMVNIIAGRRVCPEFIQHQARPAEIADAVWRTAQDGPEREAMLRALAEVVERMGSPGAASRAASIIASELE